MAEPPIPARTHRLRSLDGLRAVAIALVVVHHLALVPRSWSSAPGWKGYLSAAINNTTSSGVELFFVLSGVVLLWPYARSTRRLDLGDYLRRRVQRLWPPYLVVWAAACILVAVTTYAPNPNFDSPNRFSAIGAARQLAIVNFGWPAYNGAWWSLTLEIAFYVAMPLVLLAIRPRWSRAGLFTAFVTVVAISIAVPWAAARDSRIATVPLLVGLAAYSPCFFLGSLLARYPCDLRLAKGMMAFGAIDVLLAPFAPAINAHIGYALLYAGLVAMALQEHTTPHRLLALPLSVWVGERSYSLFLTHYTVFFGVFYVMGWFLRRGSTSYLIATRLVMLPLSLIAAQALFWFVERKFARNLHTADEFWPPLRARVRSSGHVALAPLAGAELPV